MNSFGAVPLSSVLHSFILSIFLFLTSKHIHMVYDEFNIANPVSLVLDRSLPQVWRAQS